MRPSSAHWTPAARRRSARRAFTFIELIVALALTLILMRGMYTVFRAATDLTCVAQEKMGQTLEISAIFDSIAGDLARAPYSGDRLFKVSDGGGTFVFRAASVSAGADDVFIRYRFVSGSPYGKLVRGVYKEETCQNGVDEDGDGHNEINMVVGRQVASLDVKYYKPTDPENPGDFHGSAPWKATSTIDTKAVKFVISLGTTAPDPILKDETFTMIIPIMGL